ncbi:MAG: hypothetical protein GY866_04945 [Proteobacteria bacterium]|nr:hypothetical protein [Pseudomonadota bacterium]
MNVEDIDTMYETTFKKNVEIQSLVTEVKDVNQILAFLYETEIKRPNMTLNSMIDDYESLIVKLRELHADILSSLEEFGIEEELATSISENEAISEKVKELMLWKLRRLYMVYDDEPVLPYIEGDLADFDLIPAEPEEGEEAEEGDADPEADQESEEGEEEAAESVEEEAAESVEEEAAESVEEEAELETVPRVRPEGGVFPTNSRDRKSE